MYWFSGKRRGSPWNWDAPSFLRLCGSLVSGSEATEPSWRAWRGAYCPNEMVMSYRATPVSLGAEPACASFLVISLSGSAIQTQRLLVLVFFEFTQR